MNRRTLLRRLVAVFSAIGLAGFSFPFIRSWTPGFDNEIILDVNVDDLTEGESRVVRWLGRNVYIVRRNKQKTLALGPGDQDREDPDSAMSKQPEFAKNPYRSRKPEHLVVYTNCTHLGCEVELISNNSFGGFNCPCHRSQYDSAGRVEKGAAAKLNLEVPGYDYIAWNVIRLKQG